jgi:hypothetical protein
MDHGSPAPGFPASLEPVIACRRSDSRGSVRVPAGLARSGLLAAPGVDVLTTAPGATYDFLSGSSLAAAHVSGIVALLLERNPRLTAADVRTLLVNTARPMSEAGSAGSPRRAGGRGRLRGRGQSGEHGLLLLSRNHHFVFVNVLALRVEDVARPDSNTARLSLSVARVSLPSASSVFGLVESSALTVT